MPLLLFVVRPCFALLFILLVIHDLQDNQVSSFSSKATTITTRTTTRTKTMKSKSTVCQRCILSENIFTSTIMLFGKLVNEDFDFSSSLAWDALYNKQQSKDTSIMEWHSSISLEYINDLLFMQQAKTCLMVGCGNSELPTVVLQNRTSSSSLSSSLQKLVLLDSSPACMQQLQTKYSPFINDGKVQCVCGDATKLSELFFGDNNDNGNNDNIVSSLEQKNEIIFSSFDVICDKGLMDALLCGEGWNDPVSRLIKGANDILTPDIGMYVLISYKLPTSTKEFLSSITNDLEWEFDISPGSTNRVGISIGKKKKKQKKLIVE